MITRLGLDRMPCLGLCMLALVAALESSKAEGPWDSSFNPNFGSGNGSVVVTVGNDVYVAHNDTGGADIYKWTQATGTWSVLPNSSLAGGIAAMAHLSGYLYVGGEFDSVGTGPPIAANNIARYRLSNATWTALGSGTDGSVKAIALQSGSSSGYFLYAGGDFVLAGGVTANNIARWNGVSWAGLSGGVDASGSQYPQFAGVNAILLDLLFDATNQVYYLDAYVGGAFTKGVWNGQANNIARFRDAGSSWSKFGEGVQRMGYNPDCTIWTNLYFAFVTDLARRGSTIYVAGFFNRVDGDFDTYGDPLCAPCLCIRNQNLAQIDVPSQDLNKWVNLVSGPANLVLSVKGIDLYVGTGGQMELELFPTITPDCILRHRTTAGWQNLGLDQPGRPVGVLDLANNFYGIYTTDSRWILP